MEHILALFSSPVEWSLSMRPEAAVRIAFTFRIRVKCEDGDQNCLEVPAGPFDVAARYYLPEPEIMSGEWTIPRPAKTE